MRPVLVGMNNPLSRDPDHALFPHPPGCTGWRLWDMLQERVPGTTKGQYCRAFERRNLVEGKEWRPGEAMLRATMLTEELRGREIVLLGNSVRRAFGLPALLVHPLRWRGSTWRQLPHPSGRNLWYNDPTCRSIAALLLADLYLTSHQPQYS